MRRPRQRLALATSSGVMLATAVAVLSQLGCGFSLGGSASTGERVPYPDGGPSMGCPSWATCAAPAGGLAFEGSSGAVRAVATGGRERIRVLDVGASGAHVGDPGTTMPFDAASTGPSTFTVVDVAAPELTVVGVHRGTAHLEIFEPGTRLLIDTLAIEVQDVAQTVLTTPASRVATPGQPVLEAAADAAITDLSATLLGPIGDRLADESLALEVPTVGASSGELWVNVTHGASRLGIPLQVVDTATGIAVAIGALDFGGEGGLVSSLVIGADDTLVIDLGAPPDGQFLCAIPLDGGMPVGGSAPSFSTDDATVISFDATANGCVSFSIEGATQRSETDVHVSALGAQRDIHVVVLAPAAP